MQVLLCRPAVPGAESLLTVSCPGWPNHPNLHKKILTLLLFDILEIPQSLKSLSNAYLKLSCELETQ